MFSTNFRCAVGTKLEMTCSLSSSRFDFQLPEGSVIFSHHIKNVRLQINIVVIWHLCLGSFYLQQHHFPLICLVSFCLKLIVDVSPEEKHAKAMWKPLIVVKNIEGAEGPQKCCCCSLPPWNKHLLCELKTTLCCVKAPGFFLCGNDSSCTLVFFFLWF